MGQRERRMIQVLTRRLRFLEDRVRARRGLDLSYDRAEIAALRWAIGELEERHAVTLAGQVAATRAFRE